MKQTNLCKKYALKYRQVYHSQKEYEFVSRLLWGAVPIDKEWAIETSIFKENYSKILNDYPKLKIE